MGGLIEEVRAKRRLPTPAVCRAIRLAAGVSQVDMARELGMHRVSLARWETGARTPRGLRLRRYLELLEALQREVGV